MSVNNGHLSRFGNVKKGLIATGDSFISDDDYKNAGATIVSSSEDLLNNADITLKVLSPLEEEIKLLKEISINLSSITIFIGVVICKK